MDAILDTRLVDVLKEIKLREEIRDALLGGENQLREIFDLVLHCERGCWTEVGRQAAALSVDAGSLSPLYFEAVNWAEGTLTIR